MVDKITSASKPLEINDKLNEIIDNLGHGSYDQTYNANSTNAQSGKAVAQAVGTKQDILTGTNGINIDQERKTVSIDGAINNYAIFNENNSIVTGAALYENMFNKFPDTTNGYLMKRSDTIVGGKTNYSIGPLIANIGSDTTPVYFENGIPKPCSLSVADIRFDGPWVDKTTTVDLTNYRTKGTNASVNNIILDYLEQSSPLSSAYMIMATIAIGRKHENNGYNTYAYLYDLGRNKVADAAESVLYAYADGSKTQEYITSTQFIIYPDSDFYVSVQGTSKAKNLLSFVIYFKGYRRLGTNQ